MADEPRTANESENLATVGEAPAPALAPRPVALPPRPVSLPPRPSGTPSAPMSRPPGAPPPPPLRTAPLFRPSQQPPPPPLRSNPSQTPPPPSVSLRPAPPSMRPQTQPSAAPVVPLAPVVLSSPSASPTPQALPPAVATVPPVPVPPATVAPAATPASVARPEGTRVQELFSDLMSARKELTEKSIELRKVTSERNTLRARLIRAESTARELSSAFRAEAQLRSEFIDTHAASSAALRARISELESALATSKVGAPASEQQGLRRIRGIGPAYERALLGLGISTVAQIAALSAEDISRIAPQIKARADRIQRDDWVGQAQQLMGKGPEK